MGEDPSLWAGLPTFIGGAKSVLSTGDGHGQETVTTRFDAGVLALFAEL